MPIPETIAHVYQNALTTLFTTTTPISICYWLGDSAPRWRTPDQRYWSGDSAQRWRAPDHRYWSGDSAQRWRVSRNGAPQAEPPCLFRRAPPFRCERSEQAEPPTFTTSKILRNPQPSPIAHPRKKKRSPRIFGNRVVRRAICDLRCTTSQIANRKSQIGLSSSRHVSSPRPSRSSRARNRCPWRNRPGRG